VRGIAFTYFQSSDVVRHPLVQRIVNAYERHTKAQAGPDGLNRHSRSSMAPAPHNCRRAPDFGRWVRAALRKQARLTLRLVGARRSAPAQPQLSRA